MFRATAMTFSRGKYDSRALLCFDDHSVSQKLDEWNSLVGCKICPIGVKFGKNAFTLIHRLTKGLLFVCYLRIFILNMLGVCCNLTFFTSDEIRIWTFFVLGIWYVERQIEIKRTENKWADYDASWRCSCRQTIFRTFNQTGTHW